MIWTRSVAEPRSSAFERAFANRDLLRGSARLALVWSILAAFCFLLFVLQLGLVIGLVKEQGRLDVRLPDSASVRLFESWTGMRFPSAAFLPNSQPVVTGTLAQHGETAVKDGKVKDAQGHATAPSDSSTEQESSLPRPTPEATSEPTPAAGSAATTETAGPTEATAGSAGPARTADSTNPAGEAGPRAHDTIPTSTPVDGLAVPAENAAESVATSFLDHGLLPSVWRSRHDWWGGLLAWFYRKVPLLQSNVTALIVLLGGLIVTLLLRLICLSKVRVHCRRAALDVATSMRRNLHRQALRIGPEDLDGKQATQTATLFVNSVEEAQQAIFQWLSRTVQLPVELVGVLIAALSVDVLLTLQWMFPLLMCAYLWRQSEQRALGLQALASDRAQGELAGLTEMLRQPRLVRGFGMEQAAQDDFQSRLTRFLQMEQLKLRAIDDRPWLRSLLVLACSAVALFLFFLLGAKLLLSTDDLSVPGAAVFVISIGLGLRAARELFQLGEIRNRGIAAAGPIYRFLDRTPAVGQAVGAKFLQPLGQILHFEQVSLDLPSGPKLLDRLDLTLEAGKTYALVSIDSRLARAMALTLPRFLEPKSGRILFDGEDIAWVTLESLRAETIFATADDPLLVGTILENIRAGHRDATLQQATEAAKEARIHNFITRLPQGYETVLSGSPDELEIGQRFRLALARAVLRNPALLIIEEPPTGLDDDTKQLLDDAYTRIIPGRTVIFLPGRLSTVRRCDLTILLHEGRVAAIGPQSRLVTESPLYRHWEYTHFNEFRHLS